jgi:hypothetical protein
MKILFSGLFYHKEHFSDVYKEVVTQFCDFGSEQMRIFVAVTWKVQKQFSMALDQKKSEWHIFVELTSVLGRFLKLNSFRLLFCDASR